MELVKFRTLSFKSGAYVYVEEQADSSEFYIVRQGKLVEENTLNNLTEEQDTILQAGDFFGVLDCMSQRPRLSSVKVLEDCILIVVKFDQFESLITQMAPVALKIIRYFSSRLRRYNGILSRLAVEHTKDPEYTSANVLFSLGKFYEYQGQSLLAGYAYSRFIESYPIEAESNNVNELLERLNYNPEAVQPLQNGIQQTYEAGVPIFLESEIGNDFYIILSGCVKITKYIDNTEVLLGILKEKDIVGEMAILENTPRSASAITSTKVTALRINRQNFELYIKTHPEIARRIIQLLSDRIWLIYKRLTNQLISDPVIRFYDALRTLVQKNRVSIQKGRPYAFDMSPEELIQFVGIDLETGLQVFDQIIHTDPSLYIEKNKIFSKDIHNLRSVMTLSSRHTRKTSRMKN